MGIEYIALEPQVFSDHGVTSAMSAACDFCAKGIATRANASQCGWGSVMHKLGKRSRPLSINPPTRVYSAPNCAQ
jgi:hypothetical protein